MAVGSQRGVQAGGGSSAPGERQPDLLLLSAQETGNGPGQSGLFPETNLYAGSRQIAGYACAQKAAWFPLQGV
jgi:hypothetical protein